jgi:hypothetical protein
MRLAIYSDCALSSRPGLPFAAIARLSLRNDGETE